MRVSHAKVLTAVGAVCALVALASLPLAGCVPREASDSLDEKTAEAATVSVDWSVDSDCATCHAVEQESYDDLACMASLHKGQMCVECHTDVSGLSTVHEGKAATDKMPKKLKKTEVDDEACLSCHFETRDALIAATSEVVVVDSEGKAVNPHGLTPSEDHDSLHCANCHSMHDEEAVADKAKAECLNCHHVDVFECHTCHE